MDLMDLPDREQEIQSDEEEDPVTLVVKKKKDYKHQSMAEIAVDMLAEEKEKKQQRKQYRTEQEMRFARIITTGGTLLRQS